LPQLAAPALAAAAPAASSAMPVGFAAIPRPLGSRAQIKHAGQMARLEREREKVVQSMFDTLARPATPVAASSASLVQRAGEPRAGIRRVLPKEDDEDDKEFLSTTARLNEMRLQGLLNNIRPVGTDRPAAAAPAASSAMPVGFAAISRPLGSEAEIEHAREMARLERERREVVQSMFDTLARPAIPVAASSAASVAPSEVKSLSGTNFDRVRDAIVAGIQARCVGSPYYAQQLSASASDLRQFRGLAKDLVESFMRDQRVDSIERKMRTWQDVFVRRDPIRAEIAFGMIYTLCIGVRDFIELDFKGRVFIVPFRGNSTVESYIAWLKTQAPQLLAYCQAEITEMDTVVASMKRPQRR
jgi:hypothetical protein